LVACIPSCWLAFAFLAFAFLAFAFLAFAFLALAFAVVLGEWLLIRSQSLQKVE